MRQVVIQATSGGLTQSNSILTTQVGHGRLSPGADHRPPSHLVDNSCRVSPVFDNRISSIGSHVDNSRGQEPDNNISITDNKLSSIDNSYRRTVSSPVTRDTRENTCPVVRTQQSCPETLNVPQRRPPPISKQRTPPPIPARRRPPQGPPV